MDPMEVEATVTSEICAPKSPAFKRRSYRRPISCDGLSTASEATAAPPTASTLNQNGRHTTDGIGKKKKKNRRAKRRRWKPYHKLSSEEKREMDRKQEEKAERFRAERLANGQPMAPYNTTQFLVEDLESRTVDALMHEAQHHRERTTSGSLSMFDSEGSVYSGTSSGPDSIGDADDLEFEAEYENAEAERLEAIPKPELVRQYMQLSHRLEHAEKTRDDLVKQVSQLTEEHRKLKQTLKADDQPDPNTKPSSPPPSNPQSPSAQAVTDPKPDQDLAICNDDSAT